MMKVKNSWKDVFPEIYAYSPVLLSAQALKIFPPIPFPFEKDILLAEILCHLTGYYLDGLIFHYHPSDDDPEIDEYLIEFSSFLKKNEIRKPVCEWNYYSFPDIASAEAFIEKLRHIPKPPTTINQKLRTIYSYIDKVYEVKSKDGMEFIQSMYNLSIFWENLQTQPFMQMGMTGDILKAAESQIKKNEKRQLNNFNSFYYWGEEYNHYFQEFMDSGLCAKTSHQKARLKFTEHHPISDGDSCEVYPGLSTNSLKNIKHSI